MTKYMTGVRIRSIQIYLVSYYLFEETGQIKPRKTNRRYMEKLKLVDELVKALGLTPKEVMKHWQDTGAIKPTLFSRSQTRSHKKRNKRNFEPDPKPEKVSALKKMSLHFMTEDEILKAIKTILSNQTGEPEENIQRDTLLLNLGIDSLDFMEIMMHIEKTFDISVPDSDVENAADTVQDIVDYLISRKSRME